MGLDRDVLVRLGLADADEEAGVTVLVDHHVVGGIGADHMTQHPRRPVVGVHPDVEERLAVVRPHRGAGGCRDHVGEIVAALRLAHVEREILRSLVVVGIGDGAVVGAVADAADAEIGLARRHRLAVDQHLLVAAVAPGAHDQRMFGAVPVARRIGVVAVRRGDGEVVFLDAPAHLLEQLEAERLDVGHRRLGVGVLRLEVGADVGGEHGRVVHHLAPVAGAQPSVVVRSADAVVGRRHRPPFGDRRLQPADAAGPGAVRARLTFPACHPASTSARFRSCSSAAPSAAARRGRRGRDGRRTSRSGPRCAPCRASCR